MTNQQAFDWMMAEKPIKVDAKARKQLTALSKGKWFIVWIHVTGVCRIQSESHSETTINCVELKSF